MVDVGGGSTEIAIGTVDGGVDWWRSFAFGSGFLADAYLGGDPPTAAELDEARFHAAQVLKDVDPPPIDAAVAVGGSAASLRRLVGDALDRHSLARALEALTSGPAADVARRFELDPQRVRLMPAGLLALEAAGLALGQPLQIARGGLREGVLLDLAGRNKSFTETVPGVRESAVVTDVTSPPEANDTPEVPDLADRSYYFNRELSWLEFNDRVLQIAEDPEVPLLERVKFLAIVSSNLDEFVMVRVAGLHDQIDAGIEKPLQDGRTPKETLEAIRVLRARARTTARAAVWTASCGPRWPSTASASSATTTCPRTSGAASTSASGARSSPS